MSALDSGDRDLIRATQAGLPLVSHPYHEVADQLGADPEEVKTRLTRMLATGLIRRIGAVPNHYRLGYRANGMSVWDVDDAQVSEIGARVGALPFISHCYRRPRQLPLWRYNLFAMVHGRSRAKVEAGVAEIAALIGAAASAHDTLYSTRILKKTGLRLT